MDSALIEKIEAFVNGEMSDEEAALFRNELASDAALNEQFKLYISLHDTLGRSFTNKEKEQNLQHTITELNEEFLKESKKVIPIKKKLRWYAIAASIIILIGSWFLFTHKYEPSANDLYAQYAVHEPLSETRGLSDSLLSSAIDFYNNRQYKTALPLLASYLKDNPDNTEAEMALHICELETGNYNACMAGFNKIAATQNAYTHQAKWYIALTYLKQNNIAFCKATLQQIPVDADTYSKAQNLLKELR